MKAIKIIKIFSLIFVFFFAFSLGMHLHGSDTQYENKFNPTKDHLLRKFNVNSVEELKLKLECSDESYKNSHSFTGLSFFGLFPFAAFILTVNKNLLKKKKLILIGIFATVFSVGFFSGLLVHSFSQSFENLNIYLDNLPSTATYIIDTDGTNYWATRYDGKIEFIGTDASTVINNALEAVGQAGGGTVFLREGLYIIYGAIDIRYDNITLKGSGAGTVLKLHNRIQDTLTSDASAGQDYIVVNNPSQWRAGVAVKIENELRWIDHIEGNKLYLTYALAYSHSAGTTIYSTGNVIERHDSSSTFLKNVVIEDLVIDGNKETHIDYFGTWNQQNGIHIYNPENLQIRRVVVKNCRREGIELVDYKDVIISDSVAIDNGWDGFALAKTAGTPADWGRRAIITNCIATGHGDMGFRVTMRNQDVIITNNIAYNNKGTQGAVNSQIGFSIEGGGMAKVILSNNIIFNNTNGIYADVLEGEVVITNNYIYNNTGAGIYLNKDGSGLVGTGSFLIDGNILKDNHHGILSEFENVVISNNIFDATKNGAYSHIHFDYNLILHNIKIIGNELKNAGVNGVDNRPAIYLAGVANVTIEGNRIWDSRTQKKQSYAIAFFETNYDVVIRNNDVRNWGFGDFPFLGLNSITHLTIEGNKGYRTENSGTALNLANGGHIQHGLAGKPDIVILTCLNATYNGQPILVYWNEQETTSEYIVVNIYWANGTAITTPVIAVSWYAQYQPP